MKGIETSLKDLYERLITLEAKMDAKTENDKIVAKVFKRFVFVMIGFQLLNFIITYLVFSDHHRIIEFLK